MKITAMDGCDCGIVWHDDNGQLAQDCSEDACYVGAKCEIDGEIVAEYIDGEDIVWHRDIDDEDAREDITRQCVQACNDAYWDAERACCINPAHDARERTSLIDYIQDHIDAGRVAWKSSPRELGSEFANEYDLGVSAEIPDDNADVLTAAEWVDAYYRYPDGVTQSFVGVSTGKKR